MRKIVFISFLLTTACFAQVGINTSNPKGALDITSIDDLGLVIPRVTSLEDVSDNNGGDAPNGTIVYDETRETTCFRINDNWICLGENGSSIHPTFEPPEDLACIGIDYIKASNPNFSDYFGGAIVLSGDGNTLAVGATFESSNATGIDGDQTNNDASISGAVYIFVKNGEAWSQQAYIKASNTDINDFFGVAVSISDDGNTLAVGAGGEDSNATGINGDQSNNLSSSSGAVYVFVRTGSSWTQQAYIKASNANSEDGFGSSVSISDDGDSLAVGALNEDSNATGVNGDQTNDLTSRAGAAYIFTRSGTTWAQEAYIKASNPDIDDFFGGVTLSGDGLTLAVNAGGEDSNATGINGNQTDNSASLSGAVYIFIKSGGVWSQQAYIKASNAEFSDRFGSISISDNGNNLVVGAGFEDSNATGINGDQTNNSANTSGAAYIFERSGTIWTQEAYIKASNTGINDLFGRSVCISGDGNTVLIGAIQEDSNSTCVNGNEINNLADQSGAAYLFEKSGGTWSQQQYLKASNAESNDSFGGALTLSDNGDTVIVSAVIEDSGATGFNGDQSDNSVEFSGAVYVFEN